MESSSLSDDVLLLEGEIGWRGMVISRQIAHISVQNSKTLPCPS